MAQDRFIQICEGPKIRLRPLTTRKGGTWWSLTTANGKAAKYGLPVAGSTFSSLPLRASFEGTEFSLEAGTTDDGRPYSKGTHTFDDSDGETRQVTVKISRRKAGGYNVTAKVTRVPSRGPRAVEIVDGVLG